MSAIDLLLAAIGMLAEAVAHLFKKLPSMNKLYDLVMRWLLGADKWGNAALADGSAKQTISAHAWELEAEGKLWGFMRPVLDWFLGEGHCHRAYMTWLKDGGPLQ